MSALSVKLLKSLRDAPGQTALELADGLQSDWYSTRIVGAELKSMQDDGVVTSQRQGGVLRWRVKA